MGGMSSKLTVSQRGLDLIKQFEAFRPRVYLCPAGKRTIGYGHVLLKSDVIKPPISIVEAEDLLRQDCCIPENYINACAKVPLRQNEFDALVSLVFNIGVGNFDRSTLLRKLQAGDRAGAAAEFTNWNKIGGQYSRGLSRRRAAERALFQEIIK